MQKPAHLEPSAAVAQHRREQHQVVVVNPHQIRLSRKRRDHIRKLFVDALVGEPLRMLLGTVVIFVGRARHNVMEERPEHVVAKPIVVRRGLLRREKDWHTASRAQRAIDLVQLRRCRVFGHRAPADPNSAHELYAKER